MHNIISYTFQLRIIKPGGQILESLLQCSLFLLSSVAWLAMIRAVLRALQSVLDSVWAVLFVKLKTGEEELSQPYLNAKFVNLLDYNTRIEAYLRYFDCIMLTMEKDSDIYM
jgi:hypothetical protein